MVPVLLPLMMAEISHNLSTVAYVMGVYNLGILTSPLWGVLAERLELHRILFFVAFALAAAAIAVFPFLHGIGGWMAAAFVLGAGTAGAGTMASLFIVDFAPREEWEPRIGLLQSFNGAGQVIGLLLAGIFSHGQFDGGLWLAAALLMPALMLGGVGLPVGRVKRGPDEHPHRLLDVRALAAFPRVGVVSGIGFHFHHFNLHGLSHALDILGTPFGRFILSWFLWELGVSGFFTYFPLMLEHSYGVNTHLSAVLYASGAAVGIAVFVLASGWVARFGGRIVFQAGLAMRLTGFVLLLLPYLLPVAPRWVFAAAGFVLLVLGWPLLSVAGTSLAARLAPFSEGAAMGLFNASQALAAVIGTFASGPLIAAMGYRALAWMGVAGIVLAMAIGARLPPRPAAVVTGQGKNGDTNPI